MAGTETFTVIRPPGRDNFGNAPIASPERWDVPGWLFAPGPSAEMGLGSGQVATDGTGYGPPVVEINAIVPGGIKSTDKISVRGDLYDVVGRVQDWGTNGSVVLLKLVTG